MGGTPWEKDVVKERIWQFFSVVTKGVVSKSVRQCSNSKLKLLIRARRGVRVRVGQAGGRRDSERV